MELTGVGRVISWRMAGVRWVGEGQVMASGRLASVGEGLRALWTAGALGGVDDAVLIGRFAERRDEVAEAAFRVLVERHGPMVVRVCRQVVGDGQDAEEAAQAVFL